MTRGDERSGRQRLIDAAMRLAAERRSLGGLGVRELTREAGLSPAAFYRHFVDLEVLGLAVIQEIEAILLGTLSGLWKNLRDSQALTGMSLQAYFDLVQARQDAFVVCARERYGVSAAWRDAVGQLQRHLAQELARELAHSELFSRLPLQELEAAAVDVIEQVNGRMLDFVTADTQQREQIRQHTEDTVQRQFAGLLLLQQASAPASV
ncbi:MAG: TetR family transcriptional regulator [Oceanococcaceae bacterium]